MIDPKRYLTHLFIEFERLGYSEDQIVSALYDYYERELAC